MTVKVERRHDADADAGHQAGRDLAAMVKNTIGVSVTVDVIEPDGVERSMGKMRRIVDQRPKA
jgi:phenylacetate-CoA ligase